MDEYGGCPNHNSDTCTCGSGAVSKEIVEDAISRLELLKLELCDEIDDLIDSLEIDIQEEKQ